MAIRKIPYTYKKIESSMKATKFSKSIHKNFAYIEFCGVITTICISGKNDLYGFIVFANICIIPLILLLCEDRIIKLILNHDKFHIRCMSAGMIVFKNEREAKAWENIMVLPDLEWAMPLVEPIFLIPLALSAIEILLLSQIK